jgi:hypothetical protein
MAKIIDTKTPIAPVPITNNSITLTVVVLDENSQPAKDAKVSVTPPNDAGVTNSAGEIQFTLNGNVTKYDVTAKAGGKTVTVPYYVTQGGATRLVVNPVYVSSIEAKLHPWWSSSGFITGVSVGLGVIILIVVVWKLIKRRRRRRQT